MHSRSPAANIPGPYSARRTLHRRRRRHGRWVPPRGPKSPEPPRLSRALSRAVQSPECQPCHPRPPLLQTSALAPTQPIRRRAKIGLYLPSETVRRPRVPVVQRRRLVAVAVAVAVAMVWLWLWLLRRQEIDDNLSNSVRTQVLVDATLRQLPTHRMWFAKRTHT